ncbi:MAG: 30S ribosome-binding factor RbfA [Sphingobacteriales bacterium]|nr:30S ribosome-binding factor RbfA [Sphingobacteriales bacterium]MCC7223207.1 30S ribosome-binding factor RbfA [Chitinophagales bacterium]
MASIKQQQVASLLQHSLGDIFIREGRNIYGNAFVTIMQVRLTPDLLLARIYLSVYNMPDKQAIVGIIEESKGHIRHLLGMQIRNKVRRIPDLEFYLDDTLDEVARIDALFDRINTEDAKRDNDEHNQ